MIAKIIDILLNYVDPEDEITAETNIKSDLGMTSFDLVCFANEILDDCGVVLTPDNFREFNTVGEIADFINTAKANA